MERRAPPGCPSFLGNTANGNAKVPIATSPLYQLDDLFAPGKMSRLSPEARTAFSKVSDWLRDYICREHPDLGRNGAVCPFVGPSIQRRVLWLTFVEDPGISEAAATVLVEECRDVFLKLRGPEPDQIEYCTLLIIFPHLSEADSGRYIDGIQRVLKNRFVADGVMLGEFHNSNQTPGTWNPEFRPNRSVVPLLAIRYMAKSDLRFLQRKPEWVLAWVRYHLDKLPPSEVCGLLQAALCTSQKPRTEEQEARVSDQVVPTR